MVTPRLFSALMNKADQLVTLHRRRKGSKESVSTSLRSFSLPNSHNGHFGIGVESSEDDNTYNKIESLELKDTVMWSKNIPQASPAMSKPNFVTIRDKYERDLYIGDCAVLNSTDSSSTFKLARPPQLK